ncbi:MAG TPA: hypothetical protein VHA33_10270 [Candidatus Angelobacter sp.]|jgi:hypothetical protein|nr:hypothetical protein [Candidatus Angelobacter sp.]
MSYTSILVHYVFATHERRPLVSDEVQPKLWAYMGGIARTQGMKALALDLETTWDCSLGRMTQPSLRDFVGSDCLPGIPLTLHAGLLSAAPAALVATCLAS